MRLALLLVTLLLFSVSAHAQSGCRQTGKVTPGHIASWATDCVLQDGGTPADPQITGGLGVLSGNQQSIGINNARNTGPYNQLGFGVTSSGGFITLTPFGGAPDLSLNIRAPALNFIVNGVTYPFPGSSGGPFLPLSGGTVTGPTIFNGALSASAGGSLTGTFSGNPTFSGSPTFNGSETGLAVTNNATVGGTFGVTGQTNIGGPLWSVMPGVISNGIRAFSENLAFSGTATDAPSILNLFQSISDTVANANGLDFFHITHNYGGSTLNGSRNSFVVASSLATTTGNTIGAGAPDYVAGSFFFNGLVANGGTGFPIAQNSGAGFSLNTVAQLFSGATFYNGLVGYELDMKIATGASARNKVGLNLVQLNGDNVAGSNDDIALDFSNQFAQGSGIGWKYGISFGSQDSYFPIASTGTLIYAQSHSGTLNAANGMDFSNVTFSTAFLRSAQFSVSGQGAIAQSLGSQFNLTSNNLINAASLWNFSSVFAGNAGGAGTPLTGNSYVNSYNIADQAFSSGAIFGWAFTDAVGTNSNSASGARAAMTVSLVAPSGGTITNGGIWTGLQGNAWSATNFGGVSTAYSGTLNGGNLVTLIQGGATFMQGASGLEIDLAAETGSSYDELVGLLIAPLALHQIAGYTNTNAGIVFSGQVGTRPDLIFGLKFGDQSSASVMDSYAKLLFVSQGFANSTQTLASGVDVSNATMQAPYIRAPYSQELTLHATGITAATRLTTDGAAANGFVYDAIVTNSGNSYTAHPTTTVTGGSGAVIHFEPGPGPLARPGVFTPGSGVPAEATLAISGGGGSSAAASLVVSGNTLNFAINSAIYVSCKISAWDTVGDAKGWTIDFGARMGATASTTAIIGSPTWTVTFDTGSAPLALSNPTADTTLGGIIITGTPTAVTASYGGKCSMTKSTRF